MSWGLSSAVLLSRLLMAAIFIQAGITKAQAPAATMANFVKLGLPVPGAAYAVTLAVEIGIALAFLLGWKTRASALALAVWCVATALVAHYQPMQTTQLLKNLCMAGGFLQVAVYGAGRFSLDRR